MNFANHSLEITEKPRLVLFFLIMIVLLIIIPLSNDGATYAIKWWDTYTTGVMWSALTGFVGLLGFGITIIPNKLKIILESIGVTIKARGLIITPQNVNIALFGVGGVGKTTFTQMISDIDRGKETSETTVVNIVKFLKHTKSKHVDCQVIDFRGQDPRNYVKYIHKNNIKIDFVVILLAVYEVNKDDGDQYIAIPCDPENKEEARANLEKYQGDIFIDWPLLDLFETFKSSCAPASNYILLHNQMDVIDDIDIQSKINVVKCLHEGIVKIINKNFKQAYSVSFDIPQRFVSLKQEREYLDTGEEKLLTIGSEIFEKCLESTSSGEEK